MCMLCVLKEKSTQETEIWELSVQRYLKPWGQMKSPVEKALNRRRMENPTLNGQENKYESAKRVNGVARQQEESGKHVVKFK